MLCHSQVDPQWSTSCLSDKIRTVRCRQAWLGVFCVPFIKHSNTDSSDSWWMLRKEATSEVDPQADLNPPFPSGFMLVVPALRQPHVLQRHRDVLIVARHLQPPVKPSTTANLPCHESAASMTTAWRQSWAISNHTAQGATGLLQPLPSHTPLHTHSAFPAPVGSVGVPSCWSVQHVVAWLQVCPCCW